MSQTQNEQFLPIPSPSCTENEKNQAAIVENDQANTQFQCHMCEKSFSEERDLIKHVKSHGVLKPYKCEFCGQSFSNRSRFTKHVKAHSKTNTYKCHSCGMSFVWESKLLKHLKCQYTARTKVYAKALGFPGNQNIMNHDMICVKNLCRTVRNEVFLKV